MTANLLLSNSLRVVYFGRHPPAWGSAVGSVTLGNESFMQGAWTIVSSCGGGQYCIIGALVPGELCAVLTGI
jgi:hypothetical protein